MTHYETFCSKCDKIIQEILDTEKNYVQSLKEGIDSYILQFDCMDLPDTLNDQRKYIFANVEDIYEFHKWIFLPKLRRCGHDAKKISDTFTNYVENNKFDYYITYVVHRKKAEQLCVQHDYFFRQIQKDRLGVRSFLLQPVQRLPRYRMLLGEMAKDLASGDLDANKSALASCCVAEKKIQGVLNNVNIYCE